MSMINEVIEASLCWPDGPWWTPETMNADPTPLLWPLLGRGSVVDHCVVEVFRGSPLVECQSLQLVISVTARHTDVRDCVFVTNFHMCMPRL